MPISLLEKVKDVWWTAEKRLPNKKVLLKRYLDEDSYLMPWLVPDEESSLPPNKLTKPKDSFSEVYQMSIKLNLKFPFNLIFPGSTERTMTQNDFGTILRYIENEIESLDNKSAYHAQHHKNRQEKTQNSKMTN